MNAPNALSDPLVTIIERLRAAVRTDVAPLGVDPALIALASLPMHQTKGR